MTPADPSEPPTREFLVHYSTGEPAQPGQPPNNTFGLSGEGKLVVERGVLRFEGARRGFTLSGTPRLAISDVANVDYSAANRAFLIRNRNGQHYIIVWLTSAEDAEALWAMLPQEKSPEFLADQEAHQRFGKAMTTLGPRALVTPSIIAINVAVFLVMLAAGADLMNPNPAIHIRFGSNFGPLTWTGQEWRLLTSAFLHFGLIHIALNMYALYQAGGLVERLFGSVRFALIYLLAALAGSVASGWWDPMRNSAGASGAIFGVYGALLAFVAVRRVDLPPSMLRSLRSSALLFCLYSLVIGVAHPLIDNACHIGGLLGGLVSGVILARPFVPEARATPQPGRLLLAVLVVGLPLVFLAQPLIADGPKSGGLRFQRDLQAFSAAEGEIVRRQTEILTLSPDARVSRQALALRLRREVLAPWHQASKPLMEATTLPQDGSRSSRMQQAIRDYLRARTSAIELRAVSMETGDPNDELRALQAERRLSESLDAVNTLANEH